ncbi:MAG: DUF3486 family protein [Verrucomicrobiae bacterium]|nr:DUF3486 family protein [Verrucomicrobiae bacterium]
MRHAMVSREFGVSCSLSALSGFWQEVCVPVLLKRRSQAVEAAEEIAAEATRTPGRFDAATVDAIKQKAFELAISPLAKPKDVKALFMLLQKSRDQELKEQQIALESRRVAILESRLAQVQAAVSEAKAAGGLTPETLAKIEAAAKIL